MSAGSLVKVDNGVKVIAPVIALTDHVPSFATTKDSPALAVPTICTFVGSISFSTSLSFTSTSTVVASPETPVLESRTATGAVCG